MPGSTLAGCPNQRRMHKQLSGSQKGKPYGQRAQVETGISMVKRNLGDALRCRSDSARQRELVFRTIVHNIMIIGPRRKGRDRAGTSPYASLRKLEQDLSALD